MFQIDERVDYARVQQFAAEMQHVSPRVRDEFAASFDGGEPDDFYHGLLTGYANAYVLMSSDELTLEEKKNYLAALVAFVSDNMARRGL